VRRGRRALGAAVVLLVGIARAAEIPVPGTSAHVDAAGWIDGLAVADTGGGPRQRPAAIGELSLLARVGGPFEGGHPGVMNFVHEFQNRTPSLEVNDAFAELREGDLQLRAGIQKFAWGKLDGAPPTDVLTPRDLHDPIVRDFEESKIGIPAVAVTYYLPPAPALDLSELKAQLVYVPFAVPPRAPLAEERWFPPSIRPGGVELTKEQAGFFGLPGPRLVPVMFRTLNSRPPGRLDAGGIAARISGTFRDMDWSISHYTGPETGPDAELLATAQCPVCVDPTTIRRPRLGASAYLRQAHDTIHMTGADWSAPFGGATARAEVAVFQDRPYLAVTRDVVAETLELPTVAQWAPRLKSTGHAPVPFSPLYPDRDSVEWGVGADYLVAGYLPLLQVNQVVFTDSGPPQLLSNPETRVLGSVRKRFLQDTLEVELRGVYACEKGAWFAFPRVTYRYGDNWRLRAGYLAIGGPITSVIGQYHDNDEFVFEARYAF
jgi:hypothetical protein